jgi:alkylation response protein AidB-like acyl-CoA dehydrogenase
MTAMDFTPTETQTMLHDAVAAFLNDRHGFAARQERRRAGVFHDPVFWGEVAALGLLGIEIDEEHGGSGGGFEEMAVVLELLGAALVVEPFIPSVVVAAGLIGELGTTAQKRTWLAGIANGSLIAALAHGERAARHAVGFVATQATPRGDGWRLDGAKAVTWGADVADLLLVSARTSGAPGDRDGIALFALPHNTPGLTIGAYRLYDGSGAADLVLDGVLVDADARLGGKASVLPAIEHAYDRGAAAVAVEAIGAMQRLRDVTLDYLKTRRQFGRPLGDFQVLQHRMVDLHMAVEIARSMALSAVVAIVGEVGTARAAKISAAKAAVGEAAREVGQMAVQLHGGIALTEEYAVGHYFKRLTMIERQFGSVDHHVERYARLMVA